MKVEFKIEGAKELDDLLKQLPGRVAGRVAANSLRSGARIIRDEAKRQVPVDTGDLQKSIKVLTGRTAKRDSRIVHVGVFGKDSRLAHLVEFGTAAHRIATKTKQVLAFLVGYSRVYARSVQHPGAKEKPFLRPAADAKVGEVVAEIGRVIGDGIEREAVKLAGSRRSR